MSRRIKEKDINDSLTVLELKQIAKNAGLSRYSTLTKAKLIEVLRQFIRNELTDTNLDRAGLIKIKKFLKDGQGISSEYAKQKAKKLNRLEKGMTKKEQFLEVTEGLLTPEEVRRMADDIDEKGMWIGRRESTASRPAARGASRPPVIFAPQRRKSVDSDISVELSDSSVLSPVRKPSPIKKSIVRQPSKPATRISPSKLAACENELKNCRNEVGSLKNQLEQMKRVKSPVRSSPVKPSPPREVLVSPPVVRSRQGSPKPSPSREVLVSSPVVRSRQGSPKPSPPREVLVSPPVVRSRQGSPKPSPPREVLVSSPVVPSRQGSPLKLASPALSQRSGSSVSRVSGRNRAPSGEMAEPEM